ncbi:EscU/YscU/HrcU family type III secretion system export apparatus switch protein [Escherichia coli]|nr:EscU/YscU/HrcU family type III secretion system export apparatus switch protein [Escherichia coli]
MSKDEVKREAKDTDGNPEIKGSAVAFILRYKVEVWLITSKINRDRQKPDSHCDLPIL